MSATDFERMQAAGLTPEQLAVIRQRVKRCAPVLTRVAGNIETAGKRWFEAARRQNYALAVSQNAITPEAAIAPEDLDDALRNALLASRGDIVLRTEALSHVLAAMDKRAAATGIEPDPVLRDAWTILHCRSWWECDLDATLAYLEQELKPVELESVMLAAREIDDALEKEEWTRVRLH